MSDGMTDKKKRKSTLSVLDVMRSKGTPERKYTKYEDKWEDKEMPEELMDKDAEGNIIGEETQDNFDEQVNIRTAQNAMKERTAGLGTIEKKLTDLAFPSEHSGLSGSTDEDSEGMIPYSPEEYKKRKKYKSKLSNVAYPQNVLGGK